MPISRAERISREMVNGIREQIDVEQVSEKDAIRGAALALFSKQLEGKLANLQEGETLQVTFRIDIVTSDGDVRGGSGAERNMPEYIQWRTAVFTRDGFTCRECGKGGDLQAHHVKQWAHHPEFRFDVANGVTLCRACHAEKHPHLRRLVGGAA